MRNILSIMRRDLAAYFTSPIGYIYIMVFVTVSVGLFVTGFFGSQLMTVDIRPFFDNLPLFLCVLVPAITMRVWAEERKENTWEMLLTFPMRAYELVIGKYLASMIFFGIAVFATVTVPWMLIRLGNPDAGVIFSGYVGIMLLGSMFFALGIFFSGFFKDQIVAFVVTLLACFLLFLVGLPFIASFIDGYFGSFKLGSILSELVGFFTHLSSFTRGVIDVSSVLYFVVWTVVFLTLNVMYIDGRSRPKARLIFGTALLMTVGIGLAFNWLVGDVRLARFDLTEDKVYTVADASSKLISNLDTPVTVAVYISPEADMPVGYDSLERDVTDKLEELSLASGGKLKYDVIHVSAEEYVNTMYTTQRNSFMGKEDEEEDLNDEQKYLQRLFEKGVQPFPVTVRGSASASQQFVYASLGIRYGDKDEEIIPDLNPNGIPQLEGEIVTTIYKLDMDRKPVVVLVAPRQDLTSMQMQMAQMQGFDVSQLEDPFNIIMQLLQQQDYTVERVDLSKDEPLPEEYDTLIVLNPRDLNERQRWEINRALHSGKSVIMGVQQYRWQYNFQFAGGKLNMQVQKEDWNPGVNELLDNYGLDVSKDILLDTSNMQVPVPAGRTRQMMAANTHIYIQSSSMNSDAAVTRDLGGFLYLWGTALNVDKDKLKELGLSLKTLMTTSPEAWEQPVDGEGISLEEPAEGSDVKREEYPVAVEVTGQFPDAFAGKERPAWPPPQQMPGQPPMPPEADDEGPAAPVDAAPGKLILLGSAEAFKSMYYQFMGGSSGALPFIAKAVDTVTLDEDIAAITSRGMTARTIAPPEDSVRLRWQVINYGLANALLAIAGIAVMTIRRRSRNAYTMSYAAK